MNKKISIVHLLMICLLSLLISGCSKNITKPDTVAEESIKDVVTEDDIWSEAQDVAKKVIDETGEKTISGVDLLLGFAENSDKVNEISDEMLFNLLQKVKDNYKPADTLENQYTYLYIVTCVYDRISEQYKKVHIFETLNLDEVDETLLIEVEGLRDAVSDVYGSMISDLRKKDRTM